MPVREQDWTVLRQGWNAYRETVDRWLSLVSEPDADRTALDDLIHELVQAHNRWSEALGAILEETHRH